MTAYYNEIDRFAADWLRNLSVAGHIPEGFIDTRTIESVRADDIKAPQAHFFAGIGAWTYALELAGWPDGSPVWTGSCPCQPFSVAGAGDGEDDARHLWPVWRKLIEQCQPPVLFGEQVASPAGRSWLASVSADLEALGYIVGAADLCAAGVGAPHLRQRLFFGAVHRSVVHTFGHRSRGDSRGHGGEKEENTEQGAQPGRISDGPESTGAACSVANGDNSGRLILAAPRLHAQRPLGNDLDGCGTPGTMADADRKRRQARGGEGPWSEAEWIHCRDGKARPAKPGIFPLADGAASRMGRLRAYGNAIVAQAAAAFVMSFVEAVGSL